MKIVVTGASGFLGRFVLTEFESGGHEVVGAARIHAGERFRALDVTDDKNCRRFLTEFQPDTIVHLAALADPDACERDPVLAARINVEGTANMASAALRRTLFVFISTDYIFDGQSPPYGEDSVARPVNVHGKTKNLAEELVRSRDGEHLIVRLPLLYSDDTRSARNLLALILLHDSVFLAQVTDKELLCAWIFLHGDSNGVARDKSYY